MNRVYSMSLTISQHPASINLSSSIEDTNLINLANYDLRKEADRRASFHDNAWRNEYLEADDLALVGFFYYKIPDVVKCYFCDIAIRDFEEGDIALGEHKKWSPNCPLIIRRPTSNMPIDHNALDEILPPLSYDECGFTKRRRPSRIEDEIKYPDFKLMNQRLKTFETWPVGIKQRPQELAEAGFFYSGQSDLTICFACGLKICKWEPTDNCWVEHKKHTPTLCSFLKLNHETVTLNEKNYDEFKKLPKIDVQPDKDESPVHTEVQFESICKICLERKSSILFLPCKHVAVCGVCVFGIEQICCICRTPIDEKINLFYA